MLRLRTDLGDAALQNLYLNPVAQRVQDGTAYGGSDMCASCRFALRRHGSQSGFTETRCAAVGSPAQVVPVKIANCTAYLEKGRMSLGEMQEVAWVIEQRGKQIGFLSPEELARRQGSSPLPGARTVGF